MLSLKRILLSITFLAALVIGVSAWAQYTKPLLVLDMQNTQTLPKNFRTTSDKVSAKINTIGLKDLHIAGGAQYSQLSLQSILQRLHVKHLTVIDLRQESHGFLSGNAISWYGPGDAANAGKTDNQIEEAQDQLLNTLSPQKKVTVNLILKKTTQSEIEKVKPDQYKVKTVFSEAELAENSKLGYARIYVQDFHAPADVQVDRFIQLVKQLPANDWLYFHCRAGVGRTTTFMTMYDMMKNAKNVSFDNILARQAALGGKELIKLPAPSDYKYPSAYERLQFLKRFYRYAHDNMDGFSTLWSQWIGDAHEKNMVTN